ncbi:MAG: class I SAM-dependent methyltransferase [Anaerolineae bacterium]|nr:class I SAM-dependent methyltransferase [Anaerolineae bacterium]
MSDTQQWTEADSRLYQQLANIAVPARAEQMASLLTLIPFAPDESFHVVEIGSGQGLLSSALLTCYSKATLTALDGSAAMRAETAKNINFFGRRGQVAAFDLFATDWHTYLEQADVILSSLCLHHLDHAAKRQLFATISGHLTKRGVFLIADLVAPQSPEATELFAATWDNATQDRAERIAHDPELFETFRQEQWNYYRYPDPMDKPSSLFEQLLWLKETGFTTVDCFWMQAGHAIYGGYKKVYPTTPANVSFNTALSITQNILRESK